MTRLSRRALFPCCFAGALALPAALRAQACEHPGGNRWALKTSLKPGATPARRGTFVALADLLRLPDPPDAAALNRRAFSATLAPAFANPLHLKEGDVIEVEGWIHLIALEPDGDYHLQMTASRNDGNHNLIVEVPCAAFVDSVRLRTRVAAVRAFVLNQLLHGLGPGQSGRVLSPPRFVRLRGQLFYDANQFGSAPRGKRGMKAATVWEVHPVIAMWFVVPP